MNTRRNSSNASGKKAWYCIEFYDEVLAYHVFSASYTTERGGVTMLDKADMLAPDTTHIYYWRQDERPMTGPPHGHEEGPLAKDGK